MKRLLLLLPLLLTPAAQAVDYVRCEAMQGAFQRTNQQLKSYEKQLWVESLNQARIEYCGEKPDALVQARKLLSGADDYDPDATISWMKCSSQGESGRQVWARAKALESADTQVTTLKARAAKIQSDYEAEGCY